MCVIEIIMKIILIFKVFALLIELSQNVPTIGNNIFRMIEFIVHSEFIIPNK